MKSSVVTEAAAGTAIATRPASVARTPETRIQRQRSPSALRMSSSSEPMASGLSGSCEGPAGRAGAGSGGEPMAPIISAVRRALGASRAPAAPQQPPDLLRLGHAESEDPDDVDGAPGA
jgi:hypothetical protein